MTNDEAMIATEAALEAFLAGYPGWQVEGLALAKTYAVSDFATALGHAVRIGLYAERSDHHPDLEVSWGKLRVRWSTHDVGGISDRDLAAADFCEQLLAPELAHARS
jgi:4a-hydroxytetrahydrobiopterin dehydratase